MLIAIDGSFPKEVCQDVRCPNHICQSFPETRRLYSRTPIAAISRLRKTTLGIPVISCLRVFIIEHEGERRAKTCVPGSELERLIINPFVRQHDTCCKYSHHIVFDQIGAPISQGIPETCSRSVLSIHNGLGRYGKSEDIPQCQEHSRVGNSSRDQDAMDELPS
jgi:hypothetical protein